MKSPGRLYLRAILFWIILTFACQKLTPAVQFGAILAFGRETHFLLIKIYSPMLRVASFSVLTASLVILAAFQSGGPKFPERLLPANSTIASFFYETARPAPPVSNAIDADSVKDLRIMLFNYSVYDSAYAAKVKNLIAKRLPGAVISEFWTGSAYSLRELLQDQQVVVITYPANGNSKQINEYGKELIQFARQGGSVVFSGTDQFSVLQHFGLFDLDFGYFCSDLTVHESALDHPVFQGTPSEFSLANYIYPLDISDPNFVVLADVRGYPAIGFKPQGSGKVVYLGLEYYYDESVSSRIFENTLRWLAPSPSTTITTSPEEKQPDWTERSVRRSEETLFAGTGRTSVSAPDFDLKIYPNPYFEKATLDVNLEKSNPVSIEMTDETGVAVSVLLPYRVLNSGFYRFELPNVSAGVYFVKCQIGNQTSVRKIVKVVAQ